MNTNSPAQRAALGGILTALLVLSLIAAAHLPAGRLGFYFIAAFLPVVALCQGRRGVALLSCTAACALALLLLPNKIAILPYACFLAWYAILRDLTVSLPTAFRKLLLLICFDAGVALWGFLLVRLFGVPIAELFPVEMTTLFWVGIAVAAQVAFFALDFFFGLFVDYYCERVQPRLFRHF